MSGIEVIVMVLGILLALVVGAFVVVFLIVPVFKALGWILRQVFRFIAGEITDFARAIGALITALFLIPLVVGTVVVGRWSATAHYGRAFHSELGGFFTCLYRIIIGHPIRLVALGSMVEGIERRLPEVMAAAPGADRPRGKAAIFDGYRIVGSLPVGGSGARLYVAEPDPVKAAALLRLGFSDVNQVVIKSFALSEGSSLPQIVRESRSLDAAKKMGLILDHELAADRFFYVMRYVPGESLTLVTRRLHAGSPPGGLGDPQLRLALGYAGDLASTLAAYHAGGLWHKDVKPDNIIVDANTGRATLVDFGLLSSLRSAMTLTTHGTEYFRDPELVRLALKGVKVHDVDGTKFDLYAAGAVLYSIIEDSFPAHGVLSQVSKRCPEAVKWIIRRSMTDYEKRYANAGDMLADLRRVLAAADPCALRPADLPSMTGGAGAPSANEPFAQAKGSLNQSSPYEPFAQAKGPLNQSSPYEPFAQAKGSSTGEQVRQAGERFAKADAAAAAYRAANGAFHGSGQAAPASGSPKIRVTNWWTGASYVEPQAASPSPDSPRDWAQAARNWANVGAPAGGPVRHAPRPAGERRSAADQLKAAADRVQSARRRAAERSPFRRRSRNYNNSINAGVAAALVMGGLLVAGLVIGSGAIARHARTVQRAARAQITSSTEWEQAARDFEARRTAADHRAAPHDAARDTQVRWDESVAAVTNPRVSAAPEPAAATALEGDVLVICDIMQPLSDQARTHVEHLVASLKGLHLTLHGNVPGIADPGAADPASPDVELTAQARLAVGQTPIDSRDARDRLADWLSDNTDRADVLVWVAATDRPDARPRTLVFAPQPHGDADTQSRTARLLKGVAEALAP